MWVGFGGCQRPYLANRNFAGIANFESQLIRRQDLVQRYRITTSQAVLASQQRQFLSWHGLGLGPLARGAHELTGSQPRIGHMVARTVRLFFQGNGVEASRPIVWIIGFFAFLNV